MTTAAIRFEGIDWEQVGEHARQKRIVAGDCAVRLLQLDPDFQEMEWCHKAHFGYVATGTLQIEFVDRVEQLSAGDGLAIQGGEAWKHRAIVQGDGVTLFLVESL